MALTLYKSHWVTLVRGGGACKKKKKGRYNNLSYHFFICKSLIRICSSRATSHLEDWALFAHPGFCKLYASDSRKKMTACQGLEEWGMDSCYCVKNWSWLKLTAIKDFSCKWQAFSAYTPVFHSSCNTQILLMLLLSRWRYRFLVLPTLPSSQNPPILIDFCTLNQPRIPGTPHLAMIYYLFLHIVVFDLLKFCL